MLQKCRPVQVENIIPNDKRNVGPMMGFVLTKYRKPGWKWRDPGKH